MPLYYFISYTEFSYLLDKGDSVLFYKIILIIFIILCVIISIAYVIYKKQSLALLLLNSLSGIVLLVLLKIISSYIFVKIYINTVSVFLSVLLGPAGVLLFTFIDLMFL